MKRKDTIPLVTEIITDPEVINKINVLGHLKRLRRAVRQIERLNKDGVALSATRLGKATDDLERIVKDFENGN